MTLLDNSLFRAEGPPAGSKLKEQKVSMDDLNQRGNMNTSLLLKEKHGTRMNLQESGNFNLVKLRNHGKSVTQVSS